MADFVTNRAAVNKQLEEATPARLGVGRAGTRPPTDAWLRFRLDHAQAKDAVSSELSESFLEFAREQGFPIVRSLAYDKADFISFPPKGKLLSPESIRELKAVCPQNLQVQITISDGLSARAIEENIHDVLPMLLEGLALEKISHGLPVVARYGRVAIGDQITSELGMELAIVLIGERPGLSHSGSMSAYLTYKAGPQTISSDRTVISNIHSRGTIPAEAGAHIVQIARRILSLKMSGVRLQEQL